MKVIIIRLAVDAQREQVESERAALEARDRDAACLILPPGADYEIHFDGETELAGFRAAMAALQGEPATSEAD